MNKYKIMGAKFSFYDAPLSNVVPAKNMTVFDLIKILRDRNQLKDKTFELRAASKDQQLYRRLKTTILPYVTFSGTFNRRSSAELIEHSGLIVIDLDHLGETGPLVRARIMEDDEHAILVFVSPGGDGLKVVYPIDLGIAPHGEWVNQYEAHIRQITGIYTLEVDRQCKDVARACLIPYDDEAYLNPMLDYQEPGDVVPIEFQKNLQTSYESPASSAGQPTSVVSLPLGNLKLDFNNLNTDKNFLRLCEMTKNKVGEYGRPRNQWIQKLASRCNFFGMDQKFCEDSVLKVYSTHPKSNDETDPLNVHEHFLAPIRATYATYKDKHGTWSSLEANKFETPELPAGVYKNLPCLLKDGCQLFPEVRERDIFFLGLLTVLSACMPNIKGRYDGWLMESNLFLMVVAPAASGKGNLKWAIAAVSGILRQYREAYKEELRIYESLASRKSEDGPKPQKPVRKSLMIPGNSSAAAVIQALSENSNRGLMFETEADTLANTMQNEWGNFSDILRKAFQHEPISFRRRQGNEHIEIDRSCLSVLLSGTPDQVKALLGSTENGLFSRFSFYHFKGVNRWKDVFTGDSNSPLFRDYTEFVLPASTSLLYEKCNRIEQLEFELTSYQQSKFHSNFTQWLLESEYMLGDGCNATIRRLGLIQFRIAMILTTVRNLNDLESKQRLVCGDEDFDTAMLIVNSLKLHACKIIGEMKGGNKGYEGFSNGAQKAYYLYLPSEFTREMANTMAEEIKLNLKTADKYLGKYVSAGLLERPEHGVYVKTSIGMSIAA